MSASVSSEGMSTADAASYSPMDMAEVADAIGATPLHEAGFSGKGIDIVLIDTGVAPVAALGDATRILHGPDFTPEADDPTTAMRDTNGHGTHIAGIIAGCSDTFRGIAPGARLFSIKAGDREGSTGVRQVIAALELVEQRSGHPDFNPRVVNLAYDALHGTPWDMRELDGVVNRLWDLGIVIVTATGNDGGSGLNLPAACAGTIAVGAVEQQEGAWVVASFSRKGNGQRNPHVVAPGRSLLSLRNPGSAADTDHPEGFVSDEFFRGSGTSQAAAVVTGAVALLLEAIDQMKPAEVRSRMMESAINLEGEATEAQGAGMLQVADALAMSTVEREDALAGTAWLGTAWLGTAWLGTAWLGTAWLGRDWK